MSLASCRDGRAFVVSTTRPELLRACVGVAVHPNDDRYRDLFGCCATTPLFRFPVPYLPERGPDPTKDTAIVMVCAFGDQTDVHWWRGQSRAATVRGDGRLGPIEFGEEDTRAPESANRIHARREGKRVAEARKAIWSLGGGRVGDTSFSTTDGTTFNLGLSPRIPIADQVRVESPSRDRNDGDMIRT